MWIEDSLAVADAVVIGTPRRAGDDSAKLEVAKVLWGNANGNSAIALRPPYRCTFDAQGIWLLVRRPRGYLLINPDERPMAQTEWDDCERILNNRQLGRARDVEEEDSRTVQGTRTRGARNCVGDDDPRSG